MLVQDVFIAAMEVIGATSLDEMPEASEMQKCLRHCNLMLDSWSGRKLLQLSTTQLSFPLIPLKNSYTIGTGGDFNGPKPINITSAFIRDSNNYDFPLNIVDLLLWESYEDKFASVARCENLYYDAGPSQQSVQRGTVYLYPAPDGQLSYTLFMDCQVYFSEFVNLTDSVTFPPAYFDALVQNLACKIWRPMGRTGPVPMDIKQEAERTLRVIETMNHRAQVAAVDLAKKPGNYNIYTDL